MEGQACSYIERTRSQTTSIRAVKFRVGQWARLWLDWYFDDESHYIVHESNYNRYESYLCYYLCEIGGQNSWNISCNLRRGSHVN